MVQALLTPLRPGAQNKVAIALRSKLRSSVIEPRPDLAAIRDLAVEGKERSPGPLVQRIRPARGSGSRILRRCHMYEPRVRYDPPSGGAPVGLDAPHLFGQRHGLGAVERIPKGNNTRQTSHW
jgi:hypothetical protein